MHEVERIVERLHSDGVCLGGEVVPIGEANLSFLLTVSVARDGENRQRPTNKLLEKIKSDLKEQGLIVEFVLRYEGTEEVESGLRATLLHSHGDHIRHVFASFSPPRTSVWVEPKHSIDSDIINEIKARCNNFLSLMGMELSSFSTTSEAGLPSTLLVLSEIRMLAPVALTHLKESLIAHGHVVPSLVWLERKLDIMRKDGRIVWMKGAGYSLTAKSLHQLGTSKKRGSPDVSRLLALARRAG